MIVEVGVQKEYNIHVVVLDFFKAKNDIMISVTEAFTNKKQNGNDCIHRFKIEQSVT
jgi:hypothetical protein